MREDRIRGHVCRIEVKADGPFQFGVGYGDQGKIIPFFIGDDTPSLAAGPMISLVTAAYVGNKTVEVSWTQGKVGARPTSIAMS